MIVYFLKSLGVDYDTFKNQTSIKFIYFSHYVQNWGNGNALLVIIRYFESNGVYCVMHSFFNYRLLYCNALLQ